MSYHWIYTIGDNACYWTGKLAAGVWPQSPCNVEEAWNMGYAIVGVAAILAVFVVYRRLDRWHNYYRGG